MTNLASGVIPGVLAGYLVQRSTGDELLRQSKRNRGTLEVIHDWSGSITGTLILCRDAA